MDYGNDNDNLYRVITYRRDIALAVMAGSAIGFAIGCVGLLVLVALGLMDYPPLGRFMALE